MPSPGAVHLAKFRVVALAFSALAILSVLVYLLGAGTLFRPEATLRIYVSDATGLLPKGPVRLNGIPVGIIRSVRLSGSADPNRTVEVVLTIYESFLSQIPKDSVAATSADNMLGDQYVDITKGRSTEALESGAELHFQPAQDLLKHIDITQFEAQLRTIDKLLADMESGKNAFGQFLATDDMYREVVARVAGLEHDIRAAVSSTTSLGQALYRDTAYQNASDQLRDLDNKLAQFQKSAFLRDAAGYEQIRAQVAGVSRAVQDIHKGAFVADDRQYRDWSRSLASMIRSVDDFNAGQGTGRFLVDAQPYESLNGSLKEWQSTIREFRANPQKFLYLRFHLF